MRNQGGFVSAAAKGLLYAVFAADLGNDLDGDGSALILLPPDKHTTKVAICRGTPKFDSLSASHAAVEPIFRKVTKKCGKQEIRQFPQDDGLAGTAIFASCLTT